MANMNTRRKWDISEINLSTETSNSVENSLIKPIKLVLNLNEHQSFYQYHFHEKTWINGILHRKEIKKLIHLSASQNKSGINSLHIESFDRIHLDRNLSISDKEYLNQITSILEEIKLSVNLYGTEFHLLNHQEIREKSKKVLKKLAKNYVGSNAEKQIRFFNQFYEKPHLIVEELKKYKNYGLLLPKFYGYYDSGQEKKFTVSNNQLIENLVIPISETAFINKVDEIQNLVSLKLNGEFENEISIDRCQFILSNRNVNFSPNDRPTLNQYEGFIEFEKPTGLVKNADLGIHFSFGTNYQKQITYSLKRISHEEV
jgi:hypothetical protein